jgi:hypothetical protein
VRKGGGRSKLASKGRNYFDTTKKHKDASAHYQHSAPENKKMKEER